MRSSEPGTSFPTGVRRRVESVNQGCILSVHLVHTDTEASKTKPERQTKCQVAQGLREDDKIIKSKLLHSLTLRQQQTQTLA